ncbi:MAG: hypothetical protein JRD89_02320 [Deltaproteobacteria bacterium]|nr:hypothetical protein [Deltaproteobacteria bacterium]
MQQMLADLGFYAGPISGNVDGPTLKAAADFGRSRGVTNLSHVTAEFCRMLTSEWERLQSGAVSSNSVAARAPTIVSSAPPTSRLRYPASSAAPLLDSPPEYQPPAPLAKAGWAGLDQTTQLAILGGLGLAAAGLVVLVVVGKKRKKR